MLRREDSPKKLPRLRRDVSPKKPPRLSRDASLRRLPKRRGKDLKPNIKQLRKKQSMRQSIR